MFPFMFGTVSEVLTVLSSQNNSFKIANSGRIVGAFEQDRKMGIQGRIGAEAPMVPMTLRVDGERPRTFRVGQPGSGVDDLDQARPGGADQDRGAVGGHLQRV